MDGACGIRGNELKVDDSTRIPIGMPVILPCAQDLCHNLPLGIGSESNVDKPGTSHLGRLNCRIGSQ